MAQVIAKIVFVSGEAFIRDGAGNSRRARAGEPLREGETLVTGSGAQVQVAFEDGRDMVLGSNQTLFLDVSVAAETKPDATDSALLAGSGDVDKIVQALNEGGDLDAVVEDTAAGAAGSAGDSGHSFVRLMRITETVDPLEFQFETPGGAGEAQLAATVENIPPIVVEGVSSPISLEGEDLVFLVTLSGETREPTSFTLLLTDITAAFGEDYTGSLVFTNGVTYDPLTGLVTVPAGVDGFSVSVPTVEENVFEPDEGLTLTVGGVVGTGTIVNNDAPPEVVSVGGSDPAINGVLVPEGDVAVFTVTLSNPSSTPTVFALSLVNGSALLGSDYAAGMSFSNGVTFDPATGLITIPPGVADFTVSVPTLDDNVYEGNETFGLTVGGVTGTGTIVDDADIPAIIRVGAADPALDGVVVPEGTTAVFTVEMSNPSLLDTVFDLNLTSGTATLGLDFTNALSFSNGVSYDAATGKITVPAGVTSFTVAVPTTDDTIYEQPETFNLQVGGVTGIGTITDNDEAPVVTHVGGAGGSIDSVTVPEGAAAAFTVSLSNASSTPSTFALTLAGGTALMGADFTGEMAFSNGVTYNAATGLVTVPPGVVSFQVVVPTVDDSVFEPTEQFTLSVGGVTGVGTITDNDLKPSVTHVGGDDPNVDSVTVTEGTTAVFTVNLSQASNAPMTLTFALMDGSAALGVDYTDGLSFSSGVVYANGSIVVPAGVTSFTVSVPTLNDSLAEPTEQFSLAVGGVTGTGIILDNDGGTPGVPLVTHVGDGAGLNNVTVSEGDAAVFTVNLSNPSSTATTFALTLSDGSAVLGGDYTDGMSFSNGVSYDPATGLVTVPANVTSFTVTVPTVEDGTSEPTEQFSLTVGGVTGTGTILDDDGSSPPSISHVGDGAGLNNVTVSEGDAAVFTVNLSNPSSTATTFALTLSDGTAVLGGDYTDGMSFSNGVSYDPATGLVTVPANVTSFTVTVPTVEDGTSEPTEQFSLTVGGVTGTGTILDDDGSSPPSISHVGDGAGLNNVTVSEGDAAVFTVNLSNPSSTATTFALSLSDGTAVLGGDYTANLSFTNGVSYDAATGLVTVPANVTSFTVTVPTVEDGTSEPTEQFSLTVGGVTGTGTILDDDGTPGITHVGDGTGLNNVTVSEGDAAVFTVQISTPSSTATTFALTLSDGTAVLGGDYTANLSFTNGVSYDAATGLVTVPANVTSFTVTVPTVEDGTSEPTEQFSLTVGGVTGTGTILDDDGTPGITHVGDGTGLNNVTVSEGDAAVFTVQISTPSSTATTFALTLSDGSAVLGGDYTANLSFTNGVSYDAATGLVTVPANVTSFTVTVPTVEDGTSEPTEQFSLTVGGVTGTGTILDDDGTPGITHVGDGAGLNNVTVSEGDAAVFTVQISTPSSTATTFALTLSDGTAVLGGDYTANLSFTNGVSYDAATGLVTVPANVTSFTVTVPTVEDGTSEPTEQFSLTVGGVTGTGTILDDDGTPGITHVGDGAGLNNVTVSEGDAAVFTVNLSNPSSTATTFALTLSDGSAVLGGDYTANLSFTNGVSYDPATGLVTVPANVTSFTVTVPTVEDSTSEPTEQFSLTVGGVTGTGTILDDDGTPGITHVGDGAGLNNVTVSEGDAAVFTVQISTPSSTATTFALTLSDGTAVLSGDYTANLSFTNGVSYDAATGLVTVPANVTSFTVTVPTVEDGTSEPTEQFSLTVGGVTGTGTILDDDGTPGITHVGDGAGLNNVTVSEGDAAVFTVNLSNPSSTVTTFALTLSDGSAVLGGDYTANLSFTNGVSYDPATGLVTVPANVTSFTVTVPTVEDGTSEPTEQFSLTVGGVTGTGTILDDDGTPGITHVGDTNPAIDGVTVNEGDAAVFTVNLSNPSSTATTFALSLSDGSAVLGGDYTANLSFTNGVSYDPATGLVTVPANVTSFTVTVPTVEDGTSEPTEQFSLTVGGVTGTGTILDDDGTPGITHVGDTNPAIDGVTVNEGESAVFTVNLSNPSSTATTFALSLTDGSAVLGGDYTANMSFSNGVSYDPATGLVTVPANVTSFTVTVPTVEDGTSEPTEQFSLTVGGVTGTGTILDDDGTPGITHVGDGAGLNNVTVSEGDAAVFTVNLSNPSSTATTFALSLSDGTAVLGGDYTANLSFTNGVSYDAATGLVTVPANVTSFTVTVPTVEDGTSEPTEQFSLTVGGVTGTGTILDDDGTPGITHVGDTNPAIDGVTVNEGESAVFTVNLSNPSSTATTFALSLTDGSAVLGGDYTANLSFSNGVSYDAATGLVTVPANVTSFTVTVPTVEDGTSEPTEQFSLTVGGVTGTGTILDDDGTPGITHVGDTNPAIDGVTVSEGESAVFTVNLSNPSSTATTFALTLTDGSAVLGGDYTDGMSFTNGVSYDPATGLVTVPANVTSFTVTVPTVEDGTSEPTEQFSLTVGGVTGTGTILDDDGTPGITHVGDGAGLNNVTVSEGDAAVFTVNLSNPSSTATTFALTLSDGSAVLGGDYTANLSFSNGVSYDAATGLVTVPANVTSFTVTVPTVEDGTSEPTEQFSLTVGGVTGTGTILDDDGTPGITHVGDGAGLNNVTVSEGDAAVFTVNLSNPSSTATTFALTLSDGSAVLGGDYTANLSFTNGVSYDPATGLVTVPANVTSFTVTVPTVEDSTSEPTEQFSLTVGGVTGTGTILDDDGTPGITHVGDGAGLNNVTVSEGDAAVFTVNLSNPSSTATTFALTLSDGSAVLGGDYTANLSFTNGVSYDAATGLVTVPANVTSFTVTVPTVEDGTSEPTEQFSLTVGGVTGTGTILDDDGTPGITHVGDGAGLNNVTVSEGDAAVFTVNLSNPSSTATTFALSLTDGSAVLGGDYTANLSFTNGVSYDPATGLVTVPANVTSFTVTVPTVEDGTSEPTEQFSLTVGGVTGTGTILDDDGTPGITHVGDTNPAIDGVTVNEGESAVFTVNLSNPSSTATTFALSLTDGSAVLGSDYTANLSFTNGVSYDPATGLVTVPANVTSFTVTVPTVEDGTSEPTEQFSLTVGGVTGTGTILDDDGTPGITHVGDGAGLNNVTVSEGDAAVFTVNLSNPSSTATTFALTLSDGSAVLGGDYTANLSFSNGVSYDPATGLVTVPANVTSFTVTVPTVEDGTSEPTEQFSLTVGGVTGTGTILDDDVADLGEVAATPEDTPLSGNVLDNASTPVGTLEVTGFSVAGLAGSYAPGQTATVNGVGTFTLDSLGNYTFTPHEDYAGPVPTVTYTVSNGGSSTDSTLELSVTPVADVPDVTLVLGTPVPVSTTIDSSNVGQVGQGYTVTAYNPNGSLGTVSTVSGQGSGGLVSGFGVAGAASGADGEVGYANNSAEKLVVNFTTPVTSATVQLAWLSATERASYTLYDAGGNVIGSGQVQGVTDVIDSPFVLTGANGAEISRIEFSAPRSGDDYLVHSITFNTAATYPVTLTVTPTDIDYSESVLSVTVSVPAGATLSAGTDNGNGTWTLPLVSSGAYTVTVDPVTQAVSISGLSLTVPNGVAGTITAVATVQDGVDTEVGSASVTVLGDHTVIGIVHVGGSSAGVTNVTVDEGNAAVFTVNLSGSSPTPASFALSLAEGTATQGEDYNANLSFSNGVTYDAATGKITVPAGVSSFTVSVPTLNDNVPEPSQTFSLTVGGITGTGTILDNDGTIVIGGGGGGQDNGDNTIGGTSGSDVLLGDVGGSLTTSMAATNYNISLIVDVSGSMSNASGEPGLTRMALTKQALENFADKLLDHDGIINLQMVAFSSGASTTVNINNLSASNIQTLLDAIDALAASGGTNYEAAFNQAVAWFNAQTSAGYNAAADYENVTYFLTDGDPTFYLDDSGTRQGTGSSTTYATLLNSVEAFAPLSAVSTVNGIGIGSGVNENYLRFFDNSAVTGNASATFSGTESIVLASFTGTSPGQLGSISAWTTTGSGTATISNSRLNITDPNGGGATVVTSAPVTVTEAQSQSYFTFDFATSSWNNADRLNWQLQRLGDNGWETVSSATLSAGATDVTTAAVGAGEYRFVFSVTDNSSGSGSAQARITDIRLEVPNIVEGTVGAPEIVNNASQFAAALEGSSTGLELVPVGNDTVSGGDGNDIIFGDVINTDSLPWGVGGNPARPADLLDGSGVSALETFLTLRNGSAPTEQELYDYIRANHEQFNVAGDTRGGNDTLDGGAGDDILYGQGGNDLLTGGAGNDLMYGGLGADTFAWELHDQGTPGKPAVDTVMDFDTASNSDKLDLRDLLVGEQHTGNDVGNLTDYLHFEVNAQGSTVVQISTSGAFSSGYSETAVDQSIILNGVDLVSGAGDQQQIIQDLLTRGKLVAD